jgi:hypothetical protein
MPLNLQSTIINLTETGLKDQVCELNETDDTVIRFLVT